MEDDEDKAERFHQGGFMVFWTDEDIYKCGAFKLATERYLIKNFYKVKDFLMFMEDGMMFLRMSARDADELYHFTARRKTPPTHKQLSDWFYGPDVCAKPTFAYFLLRTVGSLRYNKEADGRLKLRYEDGEKARREWMIEQVMWAYMHDFTDPLGLPEDGSLWRKLFRRAAQFPTESEKTLVYLIYTLRRLRRRYGARLYATATTLRMRVPSKERPVIFHETDSDGKKHHYYRMENGFENEEATMILLRALELCGAREWFQATMKEMVSGIDACGTASDEGVASGVGATG